MTRFQDCRACNGDGGDYRGACDRCQGTGRIAEGDVSIAGGRTTPSPEPVHVKVARKLLSAAGVAVVQVGSATMLSDPDEATDLGRAIAIAAREAGADLGYRDLVMTSECYRAEVNWLPGVFPLVVVTVAGSPVMKSMKRMLRQARAQLLRDRAPVEENPST